MDLAKELEGVQFTGGTQGLNVPDFPESTVHNNANTDPIQNCRQLERYLARVLEVDVVWVKEGQAAASSFGDLRTQILGGPDAMSGEKGNVGATAGLRFLSAHQVLMRFLDDPTAASQGPTERNEP